ncbi:MAG: hypothetical protein H0T46_02515 [Deltaproteobacteria bacterium]|nr:hypothetical protein [Deltaproteobacteria bacterium]
MANHIYIYCKADHGLEYRDVVERIDTTGPDDITIDPPSEGELATSKEWDFFAVTHGTSKRPVQIQRITGDDVRPMIDDALERLDDGTGETDRVREHLRATRQVFHIELGDVPDEVWNMLDETELFIARKLDGIIGANEGFYDAELSQLVEIE